MADETTAVAKKTKDGWRTSEFWLSAAAMIMSQLYASGVIGDGGTAAKIAALVGSLLTALGYTVARTKAKA